MVTPAQSQPYYFAASPKNQPYVSQPYIKWKQLDGCPIGLFLPYMMHTYTQTAWGIFCRHKKEGEVTKLTLITTHRYMVSRVLLTSQKVY